MTSRLVTAAVLLGLSACKEAGSRDPVIAELRSPPVRAVLRAHETDTPLECKETGLWRAKCFFKTERKGCLYLEVGSEADGPGPIPPMVAPNQPVPDLCQRFPADSRRVQLETYAGHHEAAELSGDPAGDRLAWRTGAGEWNIVYLIGGEVIGNRARRYPKGLSALLGENQAGVGGLGLRRPMLAPAVGDAGAPVVAAIDWARAPTLEDSAAELLDSMPSNEVARLLAAVKQRGGDEALLRTLKGASPSYGWWDSAWEQLTPAGKTRAADELRALLQPGADAVDETLLEWFTRHPEEEPENYAELLAAYVEQGMATDYDLGGPSSVYLDELVKRNHPRAGELGCRMLGVYSAIRPQQYDESLAPLNMSALNAIIAQKRRCPWVGVELLRSACSYELRCSANEVPQAAGSYDYAPLPGGAQQNALCSMESVTRHIAATVVSDTASDEAADPSDAMSDDASDAAPEAELAMPEEALPGVTLLAAGYAQGPLPMELLIKNARRLYRVTGLSPPRPDDDEEEPEFTACDSLPNSIEELACELPVEVTEVMIGGCRVRIEDDERTIRLDDLRTRKTPTMSSVERGYGDPYMRHRD